MPNDTRRPGWRAAIGGACVLVLTLVAMAEQPPAKPAAPAGGGAAQVTAPGGPPAARKQDLVETLHGTAVADPYRWLEESDNPEVRAWLVVKVE